jgi:hypothetical protein
MERENARERVRVVAKRISRRSGEPFRVIMLSWPSQHDHQFLREIRDNAECADLQSFYLAWLVDALTASSSRISLLGYSFGSRAVTGALHLEGGGTVFGRSRIILPSDNKASVIPNASTDGQRYPQSIYRVSLVAPAIDRNWLEPRGKYCLAMSHVDHLVNLYNSKDPILRRFRFVDRVTRPIAAGFAGLDAVADPPATAPLTGPARIEQYDCGASIGATHAELDYYTECPCFAIAIDNLLWKPTVDSQR